jgi:HlyD family secretion protein
LSSEQQAKLDAISAELRPRFMALRDLDENERRNAREKLMQEMRGKIAAMLSPEQRKKYQEMQSRASAGVGASAQAASPAVSASASVSSKATNSIANQPNSARASGKNSSQSATTAPPVTPPSPPAAGGPGGGGPLAEFRNRLVSELQLSADQQQKLDSLLTETRPKFAAMRDATPEDRPKVRERIMAELRAKINDFLLPEQKAKYAALLAELGSRSSSRGRIYVLNDEGKPVAYNVRLGITDGTATELIVSPGGPMADVLKEGVNVIVGVSGGAAPAAANRPSGPRMPF